MVTQVPVDHIICADPGDFSKGESEGHLCLTGLFSVIPPCKLRNFKFSRDGGLTPEIRVVITNESTRGVYTSLTFTVSISIRP